MAVAIWNHHPTPDDLLAARLKRGWKPTPSLLREGNRVLGFAAAVYDKVAASD